MHARHYLTCLWPGMAELWWRGQIAALPTAIAFTTAVNLALLTRFIYPEWLSGLLVRLACCVGFVAWVVWVVRSVKELPELIAPRSVSDQPDHLPEAHAAYLAGKWYEAEGLLSDLLGVEPRDPPALLLLAGVYRHTGRFDAAEQVLQQLSRIEVADGWWLEREAEERRLERARAAAIENTGPDHENTGPDHENTGPDHENAGPDHENAGPDHGGVDSAVDPNSTDRAFESFPETAEVAVENSVTADLTANRSA